MKTVVTSVALFLFLLSPGQVFSTIHEVREVHYQMGTFLEITLWHADTEIAKRLIRQAVQEVHRLDELLSNFNPDSAVSRFNQQAGKGKTKLDPDLYRLLNIALWFSAQTAGYFDITVGPLVDLWRDALSRNVVPTRDDVTRALRLVGYQKLKLYEGSQAELREPGMKIDLGGIGKGYAVDRSVELLKRAGVNSAIINFGGSSMFGIGSPPGQQGWPVGIQGPGGNMEGVLRLRDMALSTSGSLGRFWTVGGKKFGHLIDPTNGAPASQPRIATVIAVSATAAEALTKPLAILGKDALWTGKRHCESEALVISENGQLFFTAEFSSKSQWQKIAEK